MTPQTLIPRSIKPSSNALLYGVGNSSSYYSWAAASKNAIELRFDTKAASGDSRGIYAQMKFSGAGGGEVGRFWAKASATGVAAGGTVNGIHTTFSMDASATISGAANALRATLGAAQQTRTLSGTCAALQLDSDIASSNTVPSTWSFIRCTDSNSARVANFANLPNASNGTLLAAHGTDGMTHSVKCVTANGTAIYLMATTTATNRS